MRPLSLTPQVRAKWLLLFLKANPRFALLYLLHRMVPKRTRYSSLFARTRDKVGTMRVRGAQIRTDFLHSISFVDINLGLPYEQLGFDLRKGMTVVDVGAHHGLYSIKAAVQGADRVLAIEPHPGNFRQLKGNLAANALSNVIPFNAVASDTDGNAFLFESSFSGQHTIVPLAAETTKRRISVPSRTLDTLLKQLQLDPDLIKIDCEGAELMVLKGTRGILSAPRSRKVVVEVHFPSPNGVEEYFQSLGFKTRTLLHDKPIVFAEK